MNGSPPPPVLGFLSADLHNGASTILWSAVVQEAKRRGAHLVCFPGGRLGGAGADSKLRNQVYELAGPGCLDGVITWASSLGGMVDASVLEDFHQRLRELPLLSLSHQLAGAPVIRIDAYGGMRELISHLVEVHSFETIAFVRGPSEHQSAQRRYQAYLDAMADHGRRIDPRLEVGPLPWDAGAEAVRLLLDDRGLVPGRDFQALASASDLLSFGAFKALKARGYRIPQDVVLVGFNGTVESVLSQPHLTTVLLPFQDQGQAAVGRLLDLLGGSREVGDTNLPSRLVVRDSCGCPARSAVLAGAETGPEVSPASMETLAREWLDRVAELGDFRAEQIQAWFQPLGSALIQDLRNPGDRPRVLDFLEKALEHSAAGDREGRPLEWTAWQDVVSLLRSVLGRGLAGEEKKHLVSLADQCRVRISAFVEQQATARSWEEGQRAEALREAGRNLSAAWTVSELAAALDKALPRLGIPGAWLVLTETPLDPAGSGGSQARMVWGRRDGRKIDLGPEGLLFSRSELIPAALRPASGPWCLVVEPLYFQDRTVGYAVFQTGPLDGAVYEELRSDLSSALKGIFLVAEAGHARQVAEKADQIKTRLLANVSHELRTPLTQILGHVQTAGKGGGSTRELDRIRDSAEHQLRLINDLLDLSRAEIDELDLARVVLDPADLLTEVFEGYDPGEKKEGRVEWRLAVNGRLPLIQADPLRLKQVFLNLLSNAAKFTDSGTIELGARTEPPHLHFWVRDTGPGISAEVRDRIFQPFVTGSHGTGGIGLGLSITRHLVALHFGTLEMETAEGRGTTFHVRIPLPNLEDSVAPQLGQRQPLVVLLSRQETLPPDLAEWAVREGLEILTLGKEGAELPSLEGLRPRCLCWDLTGAQPRDWALVRQLRRHPGLYQAPFLLYGDRSLTGLVDKADQGGSLKLAIEAACPPGGTRPVYVIDDEEASRLSAVRIIEASMPGYPIRTFADGETAWAALADEIPGLVILDFSMPGWDGAEVLDRIRADARLRLVPVLLLSHKVFTPEDIKRIEKHTQVTLQSKGIWDDHETGDAVTRLLSGADTPPVHTSALVKRALAYMARHYQQALSRWQVAEAVNVSEDYLSRVFSRELGLSPWDFLNRYRIHQACRLLVGTNESIRTIALQVGFNDQAYFSRVFRKAMVCTPQEYRSRR